MEPAKTIHQVRDSVSLRFGPRSTQPIDDLIAQHRELLAEVRKALEFYQSTDNNSQQHLDRIVGARNAIANAEKLKV